MTDQHHDDPIGEARDRLLQGLAAVATVGEAAARWFAVGRPPPSPPVTADSPSQPQERSRDSGVTDEWEQVDRAFTDVLGRADLADTARIWRAATVVAATGNARAREAMSRAEARLRRLHPGLMFAYDRYRAAGGDPVEAMRSAARAVWQAEAAAYPPDRGRPHGGRIPNALRPGANGVALPAGGRVLDDLDQAIRTEVGRLAMGVSPEALDRLQRQWRAAGQVPSADAAGLLAQYARQARTGAILQPVLADQLDRTAQDAAASQLGGYATTERRDGTIAYGRPDLPRTPSDEHHGGMVTGAVQHHRADHDAAGAAQRRRMAQAFPPLRVGGVPADVAGKQPANAARLERQPARGR